jgi:SET domain-containing protein
MIAGMAIMKKNLQVKRSRIRGAGKGLFTSVFIPKGTKISEYKGRISTWNDARHEEGNNAYIFYLNRNHVIDAKGSKLSLAHFANDGKGLNRDKANTNNAKYITEGKRVYIEATRDIEPGEEILVGYGKEYWDTIRKYRDQKS